MPEQTKILIATKNSGKVREIAELLANLPFDLLSLNDFSNIAEPEETGANFAENARLKAVAYARQSGFWALADDSGLEVEALNGAPGVFSARYAGVNADDRQRVEKLLTEIGASADRRARFVCAMAIADERGDVKFTAEGVCTGEIAQQTRGANGFGYDSIFIPEGFQQTFGELSNDVKQQISHRKQAIGEIIRQLRRYYDPLT